MNADTWTPSDIPKAAACWCGRRLGHTGRHTTRGLSAALVEAKRAEAAVLRMSSPWQKRGERQERKKHFVHDGHGTGQLARFVMGHGAKPTLEQASLRPDNAALREGRTIFPSTVEGVGPHDDVLVSGKSNAKIGGLVVKGPWAGFPIFTLTLEERATCPTTCELWSSCYGNAMPLAKRWRYGPEFIDALERGLMWRATRFAGFVVRLHVLGDFPDVAYADRWLGWLERFPQLHVFGYTHHAPESEIGQVIAHANRYVPERWRVRFSVPPGREIAPLQATTIWRPDETARVVPEGIVCPAQTGASATCGTCGLCWARPADGKRIVFLGHGKTKRGPARAMPTAHAPAPVEAVLVAAAAVSVRQEAAVSPAAGVGWLRESLLAERDDLSARLRVVNQRLAMLGDAP